MAGTTQEVRIDWPVGGMTREQALKHCPWTRALTQCEVCADGTGAIALAKRQWKDGAVDTDVRVCGRHAQSDGSGRGLWTMVGLEFLA